MNTEPTTDTTGTEGAAGTAGTTGPRRKLERKGLGWPQIILIVLLTSIATAALTTWLISRYLFQKEFKPVELRPKEERVLNEKLQAIGMQVEENRIEGAPLEPERYRETDEMREVKFTERELNGLLAKNTDLAQKLAIDLSEDLVSAKLLVPLEPDFPVLGGKTLRVNAGMELAYRNGRPVVVLKGISIMGVPIPSAWLGGMKNIDLVQEFGGDRGFWKAFADGVDYIHVEDGRLMVKLRE